MIRPAAVLETSFWTVGHRADVAANSLDLFRLIVPRAVEQEILFRDPDYPQQEYPSATLFRRLRSQMEDPPVDVPEPLATFGFGEAAAIPLAAHLGIPLLMNDWRAVHHARALGIEVFTVPAVIVSLLTAGVLRRRAAERKLELIAPFTMKAWIDEAREEIARR